MGRAENRAIHCDGGPWILTSDTLGAKALLSNVIPQTLGTAHRVHSTPIALFLWTLHDSVATTRTEITVDEAAAVRGAVKWRVGAAIVAQLGPVLYAIAAVRGMLAVTGTPAIGAIVHLVIAGFRRLNDTIAADGRNAALGTAAASSNTILSTQIAGFTVLGLNDPVTTTCVPHADRRAVTIATHIHAIVTLLAARSVGHAVATVGILLAGQAATAALEVGVAVAVVAFLAGLNDAIAAPGRELTTRAAGAWRGGTCCDRDVLAVIALLGAVDHAVTTERAKSALGGATVVGRVAVASAVVAIFANGDETVSTLGDTIRPRRAASRDAIGRRTRATVPAFERADVGTTVTATGISVVALLVARQFSVSA